MKSSLSIVHINTHDCLGGAAKVAWRLAEGQRSRGHEACVLAGHKTCDSPHSHFFANEADPAIRPRCIDEGLLYYDFQGSHKLLGNPLVRTADIIHLHNLHGDYFNPFSLIPLARFKPVVWTLHDMQAITGHCAHSFACERWRTGCGSCPDISVYPSIKADSTARLWQDKQRIYRNSRVHVVTPSRWLGDKVGGSILGRQPRSLIYNGIDTDIFRPRDREQLRRGLNLPADAVLIGCVAHAGVLANPWKGGAYTVAAINALKERYRNCYFLNIGDDSRSTDPHIINVPNVTDESELAVYYSLMDIFLFTSIAENCPLVLLEAMSCGTPVISFATGGIPELARSGTDGLVVEYRNGAAIIEALIDSIENPDRRRLMAGNARDRVLRSFTQQKMVTDYLELYPGVIAGHRPVPAHSPIPPGVIPDIAMTRAYLRNQAADSHGIEESDRLVARGEKLYGAGDNAGARKLFAAAAEQDPTNAVAHNNLGFLSWREGDPRQALTHLSAAFDRNPNDRVTVANIVSILQELGQLELARQVCEDWLRWDPFDREMRQCGISLQSGGCL